MIEADARVSVGKVLANSGGRWCALSGCATRDGVGAEMGRAPLLSNCCQTLVGAAAGRARARLSL
jgi:hypothetical protein